MFVLAMATFCIYVSAARVSLFLCFRLSVPVQPIVWKGSSPKWRIMCRVGH